MSESYPKKYWWLVLVAVPLIVALSQIVPPLLDHGGDGQDSEGFYIAHADFGAEMYFTNVSVIEREYESSTGQALEDPELKQLLQEAVNLAQGGDANASIPLFEEAARQVQLPSIYNNLGVLYSRAEDYAAAETAYQKVIRLDPEYASTHRNLGLLKESRGRLSEAGEHFEQAADLGDSARRLDRIREEIGKGVHSREIEPNEDGFTATHIPLGVPVRAEKTDSADQDYYHFTTPPVHRDAIEVSIENGSTTLVPAFRVLNADKNDVSGWQGAGSAGGNVRYLFFSEPESDHYVHVTSSYDRTTGGYAIAVTAQEAYDGHEPNQDILNPTVIPIGRPIEAAKMDSGDQDFYQFRTRGPASLVVSIENRSPTLVPALRVLNGDKNDISGWSSASTAGGNLRYAFKAEADSVYYVHVTSSYDRTGGEYTLTVKED